MFKKLQFLLVFLVFATVCFAQPHINEDFEGIDSMSLPAGWTKWDNGNFPPYNLVPNANWTVRDSGAFQLPGLSTATGKAHSPTKACGVSWLMGVDSNGNYLQADAWLVTKRIENVIATDVLKFWATGGTANYYDSLQIWISIGDSTPQSFLTSGIKLGDIFWPTGSTYGEFTEYTYSLSGYAGLTVGWIGFRYYVDMNLATAGFFVHVDDVFVGDPSAIQQIGTNIPDKFDLKQNYPNPFNPSTTIRFDLAKNTDVSLIVYNSLGQEVARIFEGYTQAGSYEATFNASKLSSGTYYYRLTTDSFVETKKMVVVK